MKFRMPETSTDHSPNRGAARISLTLLLMVLLVFSDGIAVAQTSCTNSWTKSSVKLPPPASASQTYGLETMAAAVNNNNLYVIGGYDYQDNLFQNEVSYAPLSLTNGSLVSHACARDRETPPYRHSW
jgi:hypothetical protein